MKTILKFAYVSTILTLCLAGCSSNNSIRDSNTDDLSAPLDVTSERESAEEIAAEPDPLIQMGPEITIDFTCGQISLLGQYKLRLEQGFSNTGYGETGQEAQQEMLNDLWASTLSGDTLISTHVRAIQKAVKAGDNAAYDAAYSAASNACAVNGSGIAMRFLPGEGG